MAGGGGALCPAEALKSPVARLDVSCSTCENVLSNYSSCISSAEYKLPEVISDKVKYEKNENILQDAYPWDRQVLLSLHEHQHSKSMQPKSV